MEGAPSARPPLPAPTRRDSFPVSSAVPEVAPANVSGGGGSKSELVITWEVNGSRVSLGRFVISLRVNMTGKVPPLFLTAEIPLHANAPSHAAAAGRKRWGLPADCRVRFKSAAS